MLLMIDPRHLGLMVSFSESDRTNSLAWLPVCSGLLTGACQ